MLGVKCGDIGQLASGRVLLQPGAAAWLRADRFMQHYQLLYRRMRGDGVAMRHWLRVENTGLGGIPHRLLVDDGRLDELLAYLQDSGE